MTATLAPPRPPGLGSTELLELVPGLTYRLLDRWCAAGVIRGGCPGTGLRRTHDQLDAAVAGVCLRARALAPVRTADLARLAAALYADAAVSQGHRRPGSWLPFDVAVLAPAPAEVRLVPLAGLALALPAAGGLVVPLS